MRKEAAKQLIGKPVTCWTALNGCYIGELVEVTDHRPWRGKVKILAVTEYPVQGLSPCKPGFNARRPARYGEIRSFGHSSIEPYAGEVPDYETSLDRALQAAIERLESCLTTSLAAGGSDGLVVKWLEILKERQRERGENRGQ